MGKAGEEKKLRFTVDLGKRTKAKPHPNPLCNDEPGVRTMRNILQRYTVKAKTIRITKEITKVENGRLFVCFSTKNTKKSL